MSTYNIEFPKWRDEVYRKHGYDPRGWYGAEVAEKMHKEAMRMTYTKRLQKHSKKTNEKNENFLKNSKKQ